MRTYPALEITWPAPPTEERIGLILAAIDDEGPIAVETTDSAVRVYFPTATARGRAATRLIRAESEATCTPVDIPDEDWAERSQTALGPVTVGAITIAPPSVDRATLSGLVIWIRPSMGFGTGHHASTRLMLAFVERASVVGRSVVDVGTGSGVLALSALALGARDVVAIDVDPDALASARENVGLNQAADHVVFVEADLAQAPARLSRTFDVVLANLTGAAIGRYAGELRALAAAGGRLIVSGFQDDEAQAVASALDAAGWTVTDRVIEEGWVGLTATASPTPTTGR